MKLGRNVRGPHSDRPKKSTVAETCRTRFGDFLQGLLADMLLNNYTVRGCVFVGTLLESFKKWNIYGHKKKSAKTDIRLKCADACL
jgi:hypothetical protein